MRLAIDFDSVVADLDTAMCNAANAKFSTTYHRDQWTTWEFWDTEPEEIRDYLWKEVFQDETFTLRIPPVQDSVAVLRRLMNEHDVMIFSDRAEHFQSSVEGWFGQYGLWPEVVLTDKVLRPKAQAALERKIDLALDDAPHNVLGYADVVRRVMVYDQPWNRHIELPPNVERVFNWRQILDEI